VRVIAWLYLACLATIVALVNAGQSWLLAWVYYVPMRDKSMHFLLLGAACLGLNLALDCRKISLWGGALMWGTLLIFAFATLEEISQIWVPHRTFSYGDLLANWLGILCADRLLAFHQARQNRNAKC